MARIEALLRRSDAGAPEPVETPFAFGAWQVDPATLAARQGDRETELTRRECDLLRLLAGEPGRIVGRRRLLRELWGFEEPERVETRTVDMHIARLRKKLDAPGNGLIETVRGEGYRLVS